MAKHITVDLVPTNDYERDTYGQILESATQHDFVGRGIHNRHHRHTLRVWDNSRRPMNGQYRSPKGKQTADRYSFLWSPNANVIARHPVGAPPVMGTALALGDVVTLQIQGYVIGDFQVRANPLDNPHMVQVDIESSASRQHWIDTGDYLLVGEAS